jgi:hypothetical protein
MRTLISTFALALTIGTAGSIGTASTAEAGYYRYVYTYAYRPVHCVNVVKYTHWGPRLFRVCR